RRDRTCCALDALPVEHQDERAGRREQQHEPVGPHDGRDGRLRQDAVHHLNSLASSTEADCLRRNIATMIARPTTTSAAATAITKNASTCPSSVPRMRANVISVRFTALSMSSI